MIKNTAIAALSLAVVWLAATVVRRENFHYASAGGMCNEFDAQDPPQNTKRHNCLHAVETRTSALWLLFYALKGE